ncbi:hypothetical protein [Cellulomonas marina]|uniref:Uncharacterized protein n=1 Tax=Cellulomonas marina TaxID=988821 RepID=A0A1I0X4T8_9CELL|nr:hypothetical protein [Cellulomonas marina]GIG28893.1 hypothetical protein Cma02nite_14930 [Cellulomonas marina]SFA95063.1 hypothetical protein SAMN05421867_10469 [Cellulomonas marina]
MTVLGWLLLGSGAVAFVTALTLLFRLARPELVHDEDVALRPPLWVTAGVGVLGLCMALAGALLIW